MKQSILLFITIFVFSCQTLQKKDNAMEDSSFTVTFGSCNHQSRQNLLWEPILSYHPDLWIWGGDIVYSDTDDMERLRSDYQKVYNHPGYEKLRSTTPILGTWDDHDYGLNDGGEDFIAKDESQIEFLNFLHLPENDNRRDRKGVYHSETYHVDRNTIKVIILDTRYFRTALTPSSNPSKRYEPNPYGTGKILGESQWSWLKNELKNSTSQFNIIVSSIQFLSGEHGYESWGNFPHEMDKMIDIIKTSGAKGVIFLSGDRHISEFSRIDVEEIDYPIIDFTSSGMTHSYSTFSGEPNKYRIGEVISDKSFGKLELDLNHNVVEMSIIGEGNKKLSDLKINYSK